MPASDVAGELHRDADGRCAARREQHLGQVARHKLDQALGEREGRLIGESPRTKGQIVKLPLDRLNDFGMRVADLIMTQREVEYPVHVRLSREGSVLNIEAEATMAMPDDAMVVQVVRYDPTATVEIRRGENAGRTLTYTNIVTEWSQVGTWTGEEPFRLSLTDASDTQL